MTSTSRRLTLGELLATHYDPDGSLTSSESKKVRGAVAEYVARFFISTSSLDFIAEAADSWNGDWAALPLTRSQAEAIELSLDPGRTVFGEDD